MNKPLIRSGFGSFNYVIGPWTDYFPTNLGNADAQFGVAVGTEIQGGAKGATISAITADMPFNIAGNNNSVPWRVVVVRGRIGDGDLYNLQRAQNGWPRAVSSQLDFQWSKMTAAKTTANAYNTSAVSESESHFVFPDNTGPSCGPGEVLTVLFFPMFNETGVPGYGASNFSSVSLSVFGSYSRGRSGSDNIGDQGGRSLPAGIMGS